MQIVAVPVLSDNYAWLLVDEQTRGCAVVDPGDAGPILTRCEAEGWHPRWVLLTHHHHDHTGGVAGLARRYPDLSIFASTIDATRLDATGWPDGATETIAGRAARALYGPGHTRGSVSYYFPDAHAVFTGDTLFLAGCGRLFEGTPAEMHESLAQLGRLPPETWVYCGHEYTEKNLRFGHEVLPHDPAIAARLDEVTALRARGEPTVPARLSVELLTNPFLRATDPSVADAVGEADPLATFTALRCRRDLY